MSPADTPRPGAHPDHDLLADLAAEVLPEDIAVQIQGHVMSCADCADLLAEAEGIRALLRRSEPETMPDAVLGRLEATLVAARRAVERGEDPAVALTTPVGLTTPAGPLDRPGTAGVPGTAGASSAGVLAGSEPVTGSAAVVPPAAAPGETGPTSAPGTPTGGGPGSGRRIQRSTPGTGRVPVAAEGTRGISRLRGRAIEATGARRQLREEERADEPGLLSRMLPALRLAAVLVVVVGLGGLALHLIGRSSSDSAARSGTVAASGPPVLAPVQSTNTNYTKSDLQSQVKTLVTQSQKISASGTALSNGSALQPQAESRGGDQASGSSTATSSATATATGTAAGSTVDGSQLLRSQSALRSCLDAIGAGGDQPVAVDLARYAGQEAAIIVLNADGGGYEVWVVARTCTQGADGTIDVVPVAAS